ncbi:Class I alpha-mannosidase [Penicillium lagena]|uniref:Class I alpha-mannosidase n=1 Tax=Penicillium lagena TaxID=94218 RepID=UPI00253FE57E|nr:Class I alpha-mannosidase [Penicillium lagena]KAJ5619745.1 Class I alpha-mannosidase [Penicillium lagena]
MIYRRRSKQNLTVTVILIFLGYFVYNRFLRGPIHPPEPVRGQPPKEGQQHWAKHEYNYPVDSYLALPTKYARLPKIQHDFPGESWIQRSARVKKQNAVKEAFLHAWNGYKTHAWSRDEVSPESGGFRDPFSGWGATLVDSLDTLIIMGLDKEFKEALMALEDIDFTITRQRDINVFETVIRYVGGFLAAYDLSEGKHPILLKKAVELSDMLYDCFDTKNRMPQARWNWATSIKGGELHPGTSTVMSELGSFSVEFTRLTQLTGDLKYYDAAQRIMNELDRAQETTHLPGLWPKFVDANSLKFERNDFGIGACADSTYEYLPKQHIMVGGASDQYRRMYESAMDPIKKHIVFRAMTKDEDQHILFPADIKVNSAKGTISSHIYTAMHLSCFIGATIGLGAKLFNRPEDMYYARGLTDGCIWAYDVFPHGVMAEEFKVVPCDNMDSCAWDEKKWLDTISSDTDYARSRVKTEKLPPGVINVQDSNYKLRPEAIESVFYMWRISGDQFYQDAAWRMFKNIDAITRTKFGHSAVYDVRDDEPRKKDEMESFWTAETLKYFYLTFSDPNLVSLDDYVFNTEAHPFRRPTSSL